MISSAEEFVRLRRSEDPAEYHRAAHEPASDEVWREVIRAYPDMRRWVAHNKTVGPPILAVLADDPDRRVRSMVASRRKASEEILTKLATEECESVRHAVAYNAKAPVAVLRLLLTDPWEPVRETARSRLDQLESEEKDPRPSD